MGVTLNGQSLQVGDEVEQKSSRSLAPLVGHHYVTAVVGDEVELAREPGGAPLKDNQENPRRFKVSEFVKIRSAA